jgi:hypothetical protein
MKVYFLEVRWKGSQVIQNFGELLQDLGRSLGVTTIPDEALITINSLEILGIIYLAIAVSKLRERIAKMEGREEQRDRGWKDDIS